MKEQSDQPNKTQYYLFKAGRLFGPITHDKLTEYRANGEIYKYSWIMDEIKQTWEPIDAKPRDNPFEGTQNTLKSRDFSGAFIFMKRPYLGSVLGIHSFGIEILVNNLKSMIGGLAPNTIVKLNLADESKEQALNTEVAFQNAVEHSDGILLRFAWVGEPVKL